MGKLTLEDIKKYLENPYVCPFCESEKIRPSGVFESEDKYAWQSMDCFDCEKVWTEFFTMTTIMEGTGED